MNNMQMTDICMIFISFLSFLNSCLLCYFTYSNVKILKEHNIKSVQPICNIISSESEGIIKISVYNYGHGTMTIDSIDIINKYKKQKVAHTLFEKLPENIKLEYYSVETQVRDIAINGHIKLLEIDKSKNADKIDEIKRILGEHKIKVNYHCVYNKQYSSEKDLGILFATTHRA